MQEIRNNATFGQMLEAVRRGGKAKRDGWNGQDQYVELARDITYKNRRGDYVKADHDSLVFIGTSGIQVGWLASQADMLASDWRVYMGAEEIQNGSEE